MREGKERLLSVKGFGEGRINVLIREAGGWENLSGMLERGDVESVSSVDRISERMAVELILAYRDQDPGGMLGTEGSRAVYEGILESLGSYMNTSSGRNRTLLLVPSGDLFQREKESREYHKMRSLLESADRSEVGDLLSRIGRGRSREKQSRLDYILLCEDEQCLERVTGTGLDRRCMVVSPEELEEGMEGDIILIYNTREIDESRIPIAGAVRFDSAPEMMAPESVLDIYSGMEGQLEALSRLEKIYSREGVSSEVLDLLNKLGSYSKGARGPDQVREVVEEIRLEVEGSLKRDIEDLTLSGEDALTLLSADEPPALREIYRKHSRMAAVLVTSRLGQRRDLFIMSYPLRIDEEQVERMIREMEEEEAGERFRMKQDLAVRLSGLRSGVEEEIRWALDLDFRFGMACFVEDLDLNPFKVVDGWFGILDACHLDLRGREGSQMVSYHLGKVPGFAGTMFPFRELTDSRTALLTGANSGGKTTLLETLAQTVIMARMGLPVPAAKAYVPDISRVFYYRPRRRLDAGGLESFLKELLPLVLDVDQGSLVLADELEAMTELEAASRVIGTFVNELRKRDSYSVVVTHMAREILRFVDSRVDGIEARGLDEGHDLVVDRTPRIGKHARSTPELILKKLQMRSSGREREIYSRVLSRFDP